MKRLKKYLLLLFLSMVAVCNLSAQTADEGASLGVKLGANITGYKLKEASLKIEPGFNLGIFSSVALSKHFALQPEINLNVQNSQITVDKQVSDMQTNLLLSYIELVVTARLSLDKFYFQIGPYISYLAYTSISNKSILFTEVVSRTNFYDIDYGLVYSAGVQLKRWDIGLRFNNGLFKIGKPATPDNSLNIFRDARISSLQLYAGYYF